MDHESPASPAAADGVTSSAPAADTPVSPASAAPPAFLAALRRGRSLPVVWLVVGGVLLLVMASWWQGRSQLRELRTELAQRLTSGDTLINENRALTKQNQELLQSLAARTGALEARLAEARTQQMTLEGMYQELARSRDERLLAEVEQAVALAAQQLQLAGNVEAALVALQAADTRLARAALPQFLPLRKLINHDIDRLKALPLADVPGIALKLEGLMTLADTLPLTFEQRARAEPLVKQRLNVAPDRWWETLGQDLWTEFRQLIRVERVEQPANAEVALLSPGQVFFLRENLKLRLMTARLALMQRDGKTYREDLRQIQLWLERYFDTRDKSVTSALHMLKGLAAADLSLELPTLNETLGSLRHFKLTGAGAGDRGGK